ncbi:hypothetical protein R3P38DRAFT_2801125 [Favolaschia claudopus]|uniref:Uncharacterized protein n=1 Tax=Favolaschia claudopus TaxID=2862362 RepID=A0AAV9ZWA3_9AGAR
MVVKVIFYPSTSWCLTALLAFVAPAIAGVLGAFTAFVPRELSPSALELQRRLRPIVFQHLSLDFMSALAAYIHTSSVLGWLVLDRAYGYLHNQDLTTDWNLEDVGREDLERRVAQRKGRSKRVTSAAYDTLGMYHRPYGGRFTLSGARWSSFEFNIQATHAPGAFHDPIDAVETAASLSLHNSKAFSNAETRAATGESLADPDVVIVVNTEDLNPFYLEPKLPLLVLRAPALRYLAPLPDQSTLWRLCIGAVSLKATKPAARDSAQLRLSRQLSVPCHIGNGTVKSVPSSRCYNHFSYQQIMPTERELIRAVVEIGMDLRELRKRRRRTTSMLDSERVHGNLEDNSSG